MNEQRPDERVMALHDLTPAGVAELDRRAVEPTMSVKRTVASIRSGTVVARDRSAQASSRKRSISARERVVSPAQIT